jgi:hypothetical protein
MSQSISQTLSLQSCSLILKEYALAVFENRTLRRIFGPEIIRGLRKLHNDDLHFAEYKDELNENEIDRACSTHGEKRNAFRVLVGNLEGRGPLRRRRRGGRIILKRMLG